MSLIEEGQEIARKLGGEVIYKGPWLPNGEKGEFYGHWFTDRVTGSSFAAKTLEEAKAILIQSRKDFGAKPPVFANNPAMEEGKMQKEEREISPLWIIPVGIILGIGAALGLAVAVQAAPAVLGAILDVKWRETGTEEWHSPPISLPAYTGFDVKWRVRNNSDGRATFTTGIMSLGYYRAYGQTVTTIEPGEEADLIFIGFAGFSAGTSGSEVIYLGVLPGTVTETGEQYWYEAELVDSVTLEYSWY
ncbi:hypothetical protein ES703_78005 [subsurface metagenome]